MSGRYLLLWIWHRLLIAMGLLSVAVLGLIPIGVLNWILPLPAFLYLVGAIVSLLIVLTKINFNGFVERLKAREHAMRSRPAA
jgi:hypothetical protein